MPNSPYAERLVTLGFESEDHPQLKPLIKRVLGQGEPSVRKSPLHFAFHPLGSSTIAIDDSGKIWLHTERVDLSKDGFTLVDLKQLIQ